MVEPIVTLDAMAFEMPWVPPGITVRVDGRGEFFVRHHRHPDPTAPVVLLLHGWTASSDLQFVAAYEALAERFSIVGLDHRGHGRGLRSPDAFTLEDAADDAAAVLRALGIAPRDRRRLLDGWSDHAAPHPPAPRARGRDRGASHRAGVAGDPAGAVPLAPPADRRLVAAHEGLPLVPQPGRAQVVRCRSRVPAVRAVAGQRDVAQRRVCDGRCRSGPRPL